MNNREIFLSLILSSTGLVVWIAISELFDEVEPWDNLYYYLIGLPVMFIASAIAGYLEPKGSWRWGLFVVVLQPVALFAQGESGPLAVVGLIFFALFMMLAAACAYGGKRLRENQRI